MRIWPVPHGNLLFWFTLDHWMRATWILTFWSSSSQVSLPGLFLLFVSIYSFRSWLKLPTLLLNYDPMLWSMYTPSFLIYTDGSKSGEGVGCPAVFLYFDVFISFPVVASIFTAELCAIFLTVSRISFHGINNFVIYSDSRSAVQALGSLYTRNPLVLKIQRFLCDFHACRKFVSCWIPSLVRLSGNKKADVLAKRAIQLLPANHNALALQDYILSICRSIHVSWHSRWDQCMADGNKLAQLKPSLGPWSFSQRCRRLEVSLSRLRIGHTRLTHGHLMLVRFLLSAAVVRFAFRFFMFWLNALLILCPVIGFPFLDASASPWASVSSLRVSYF